MYLDVHSHLHHPQLFPQVQHLMNAIEARTEGEEGAAIICASAQPSDWEEQRQFFRTATERFPRLRLGFCLGLHPLMAEKPDWEEALGQLAELLAHPDLPSLAVGEIGLDHSIGRQLPQQARCELRQRQHRLLAAQLDLAQSHGLPAVIHCVKAHGHLLEELQGRRFPYGGLIHGFYASPELAASYIKLGFHISLNCQMLRRAYGSTANAAPDKPEETAKLRQRLRAIAAILPRERLLLESDCDIGHTQPKTSSQPIHDRGLPQLNETDESTKLPPATASGCPDIYSVANWVSQLYDCQPAEILAQGWQNFRNSFGWPS